MLIHSLTTCPSEILAQIIECAGSHNIISLWKCGSYTLNAKIASGVRRIDLKDTSGLNRSRYPKMLSCFTKLEHLSVILGHELLMTPQSLSVTLQQLSSTLLSLHLSSKDIDLAVLQYAPTSSESTPELEYLQYGDRVSPSWLGTKFPHMTSLSIHGSKTSPELLWPGLPPHLTSFSQCPGYTIGPDNALHLLPRSLTTLHLNLEFTKSETMADMNSYCVNLPQGLTWIYDFSSDPDACTHRNPDLVRKWSFSAGPQLSGVSINERPIQGSDRHDMVSVALNSPGEIITAIIVRSRRDGSGVDWFEFGTKDTWYGPHNPVTAPFLTEKTHKAPSNHGLTGLYVISSPEAIITEILPIWGLIAFAKCQCGPHIPPVLDINEIRSQPLAHRKTRAVKKKKLLTSSLSPQLARTFTVRATHDNIIALTSNPAQLGEPSEQDRYIDLGVDEFINRVDLHYKTWTPHRPSQNPSGIFCRSNTGLAYGKMDSDPRKSLERKAAPFGHALVDFHPGWPSIEPIWGPIISPYTLEVNPDLIKEIWVHSSYGQLRGLSTHNRQLGQVCFPAHYSLNNPQEFFTEVYILHPSRCSEPRDIGAYSLASESISYSIYPDLFRDETALRRFVAPPGHGLVSLEPFRSGESAPVPIWAPIHAPDHCYDNSDVVPPQSVSSRTRKPRKAKS